MHLSTVNEASNFSANSIQLYHSPGCSFKYAVVFFNLFLYLCCYLCVLSSIYFGFYLSERWDKELALYQCCSLTAREAQQPFDCLTPRCPCTLLTRYWKRPIFSGDCIAAVSFSSGCVFRSTEELHPSVWTTTLTPRTRSPFQASIKLSFRVTASSWGQRPSFLLVLGRCLAPMVVTLSVSQGITAIHVIVTRNGRQHSTRWDGYGLK